MIENILAQQFWNVMWLHLDNIKDVASVSKKKKLTKKQKNIKYVAQKLVYAIHPMSSSIFIIQLIPLTSLLLNF